MSDLDMAKWIELEQKTVNSSTGLTVTDIGRDAYGSIVACKIITPSARCFWLCLSETVDFVPGDGLQVKRPSEIRSEADNLLKERRNK